jgi:hypothetical protein
MSRPDVVALRNFLLSRKSCVTCVTCVTSINDNELPSYAGVNSRVTCVTEISADVRQCPDANERQAIAEMEGGVPPQYSRAFARLQVFQPTGHFRIAMAAGRRRCRPIFRRIRRTGRVARMDSRRSVRGGRARSRAPRSRRRSPHGGDGAPGRRHNDFLSVIVASMAAASKSERLCDGH